MTMLPRAKPRSHAPQSKDAPEAPLHHEESAAPSKAAAAAASQPATEPADLALQSFLERPANLSTGALCQDVRELLSVICDTEIMKREAEAAGYDSCRLPLEKLGRAAIREGFSALKAVEQALRQRCAGEGALAALAPSRRFFAALPCCGAEDHPVIDSAECLQERLALLQVLAGIEPVYGALLTLPARAARKRKAANSNQEGVQREAFTRESLERKRNLPSKLKRPMAPFFLFFNETRDSIAKELGSGMAFGADAKRAAEVWRTLPKKEKRAYKKKYQVCKQEYDKEQQLLKAQERALVSADSIFLRQYQMMACNIEPLTMGSSTWMLIYEYVRSMRPNLPEKLALGKPEQHVLRALRIFAVSRHGEDERFAKHVEDPNRMLLWHPTRSTSLAANLSHGLHAAPRDSPTAGHNFGRGIYFTDMADKAAAAQGLLAGDACDRRGLLLLAEVALGECHTANQPEPRWEKAPHGCDSVQGQGSFSPDPASAHELPGGVRVPLGPVAKVPGGCSEYNEYVVYNASQVRLRYIVEVRTASVRDALSLDTAAAAANALPRRLPGKTAAVLAPWAAAGA